VAVLDLTPVGSPEVQSTLLARVSASRPPTPGPVVVPPSQVRGRPATSAELAACKSASGLYRKATGAGWTALATYARGPLLGIKGDVLDTVDSLLLRFYWDAQTPEAAAHWVRRTDKGYALDLAYLRGRVSIGGNDLGHWLTGEQPKPKEAA